LKSDPALAQAGRDLAGLLRNGAVPVSDLARAGVTLNASGRLQANALAKLYTAQEQSASGAAGSGAGGSLFDFIA